MTWFCVNCCEEFPEPFCDLCGKHLTVMPVKESTAAAADLSRGAGSGGRKEQR